MPRLSNAQFQTLTRKAMTRRTGSHNNPHSLRAQAVADRISQTLIGGTIVNLTSFGWGYWRGRYGAPKLFGMSTELFAGLAAYGITVSPYGAGFERLWNAFADGSMGAFSHTQGVVSGITARAKAGLTPIAPQDLLRGQTHNAHEANDAGGGQALSETELRNLAQPID